MFLKVIAVLLVCIICILFKNGTIFDLEREGKYSVENNSCINDDVSSKNAYIALLLAVFVPIPGIHSFYAGRIGRGIAQLLTLNFLGIGWIYDVIMICMGKFKDSHGKRMKF